MPSWVYDYVINPFIGSIWDNLCFWRVVSFILIVAIFIAFTNKECLKKYFIRSDILEHDRGIFRRADILLPERECGSFIEQLGRGRSFFKPQREYVSDFILYFDNTGNWYLMKKMVKATKRLIREINQFLDFKSSHFFLSDIRHEAERGYMILEPQSNPNRAVGKLIPGKEYRQYVKQLDDLLYNMEEAYKNY